MNCNCSTTETRWERSDDAIRISFNNVTTVALAIGPDSAVTGITDVTVNKVPLRHGRVPLFPWIRSLNGYDYTHFRLQSIEDMPGGGVAIHTAAVGIPRLESPYGDQYNGNQLMLSQDAAPVEDDLTWLLEPVTLRLDETRYDGFSYRWRFASATQKIHRIVTHATWEIGGAADGNTILSQGQVTPAVYQAEPGTKFTSACLQSLTRFGDPTAMSFQLCPRYGVHQCFDFLAHDRGTLLGFWEARNDTRSFVQRNPGENVIFIIDAEHWKAAASVETAAKNILFAPADGEGMPEHTARNRWKDAYDHCTDSICRLFNIRRSHPAPERMLPYGQRLADGGKFELRVGDAWVPAREWLPALAEKCLPTLARQGIRRVITEPIVETDPTERGMLCKLGDSGLHSDLNVGSVCCVHRYRPADFFGGMTAWRHFCETAHSLGLEVGHWIGPHLAYHAPILREHPDWAVRGFNSLVAAGGYPNFELAVVNWNTPIRQWILEDIRRMREEGGLDYVWFDSFANLGMYPVDFAKQMESNTFALLELVSDLQRIGVKTIAVEGMSPIAISGAHIMDQGPEHDGGVPWIAGQNSWNWYEGNEDMLCGQQPRTWTHRDRDEKNIRQRLFRCLANNVTPEITRIMPVTGEPDPVTRKALDCCMSVRQDMVRREILPDKRGVLWRNGQRRVLFAFKGFSLNIGSAAKQIEAVGTDAPVTVTGDNRLDARAWTIYQWNE